MESIDKLLSRIDTTKLYPDFLAKIRQLLENCQVRGVQFYVTNGFRSPEEQAILYAKGRTAPGGIVTNAKPFQSLHQFSGAVDCCKDSDLDKPGLQPDYNDNHYKILGEEAVKLGLEWGGNFHSILDVPHVQVPYKQMGFTLQHLKELYEDGGLEAIWTEWDSWQEQNGTW